MADQILWESFLDEVTSSASKHRLWLKALSYLEYIGYRKMVKALPYGDLHRGVFHHLTDEIQHSFMLRELSDKVYSSSSLDSNSQQELKRISEAYFQDIDAQVDQWVRDVYLQEDSYRCYMFTSYLVELRAMKVYPRYLAHLSDAPSKYILQKIIKDESSHLSYLEDRMQSIPEFPSFQKSDLLDHENRCFEQFLINMRQCFEISA